MGILWQEIVIGAAVILAVAYLALWCARKPNRESRCSACPAMKNLAGGRKYDSRKTTTV